MKGQEGVCFIAFCDDEPSELDKAENLLKAYQEQSAEYRFAVKRFLRAEELLEMVRTKEYAPDVLFMDVCMPEKLGIEVAKELRKMGQDCRIVFLTASKEYALDAFSVDASQYLVKPVSQKEIFSVMDKVLKELADRKKRYLMLQVDSQVYRIALHDIIYCEAQKKCQCMYLADGTQLLLRLTMAKIREMLADYPEFVQMGVSYVINLQHIESLCAKEIQMDNQKKLHLVRGTYQTLREKYVRYYCNE